MIHRYNRYIASALIVMLFVSCVSKDTKTVDRLHYVLNNMNEKGDVIYQAKLDGFDYRTSLTSAINKDAKSLASILDYTADGQLMGVGADEHCEVLLNLLKHW